MAWMGRLLNRADEKVTIELPVNEVAATHLAILASTGSGKSYTASVLLEMLKPATRAAVLVFDPHGEYDSLDQMCDHSAFEGTDGYRPSAEIRKPDQLSVKLADLTYADLRSILSPTERMASVLVMPTTIFGARTRLLRTTSNRLATETIRMGTRPV